MINNLCVSLYRLIKYWARLAQQVVWPVAWRVLNTFCRSENKRIIEENEKDQMVGWPCLWYKIYKHIAWIDMDNITSSSPTFGSSWYSAKKNRNKGHSNTKANPTLLVSDTTPGSQKYIVPTVHKLRGDFLLNATFTVNDNETYAVLSLYQQTIKHHR